MLLKLVTRILLRKNKEFIRVVELKGKKNSEKMQGCGSNISKREYEMRLLKEVCTPVANYLKKNWNPHSTVIITDSQIRLVRDEIGIPLETAQEVTVQEQHRFISEDSDGLCSDGKGINNPIIN